MNLNFYAPALILEAKSTPGTANAVDSNLTRNFFFQTGNVPFQKKIVGLSYCLLMFCRLSYHIVELFFFPYAIFIVAALSVLIHFGCL